MSIKRTTPPKTKHEPLRQKPLTRARIEALLAARAVDARRAEAIKAWHALKGPR